MFNFASLPPLSLYIHMPWCVRKCPYCDFNSHEMKREIEERAYVDALLADLEQELPSVWGRKLYSIFIGGGTPSLFSAEALDRLLSGVRALLPYPATAEITLEANPGTIDADRFREYRALGINRLSIGIQSFNDDALQRVGRIHGRREAIRAAELAHDAGFDNFNLDLMFGLPHQTPAEALEDVNTAIALEPTHISHYQLTVEPNTYFHARPPHLPADETLWQMQERCQVRLAEQGYGHYEISAFAREDRRCQHNLNYWQFGDYLGIGAGAHGKISDARSQSVQRIWKIKSPDDYMLKARSDARIGGSRQLSRDEAAFEFMLYALRLHDGFPTPLFSSHTGLPISTVERGLKMAEERELIQWDIHTIKPTERGMNFHNDLVALFMEE